MNELQPGFGQLVQTSLDDVIDALVDDDGDLRAIRAVEWVDQSGLPSGPFVPRSRKHHGA